MVSSGLPRGAAAGAARAAAVTAAVLILGACAREQAGAGAGRVEALVQQRYRDPDAVAAGAFQWRSPDGAGYVLVDVQSTTPGLVQARADLWMVGDTGLSPVGRSEVMSAAAEIGAFAFEDMTGDGLPDLLGYVADSAGTSFAVFIPGAVGAMTDELPAAAAGWRFTAESDSLPRVGRGAAGAACYLQLWAEEPTPDGAGEGWRFLALSPGGRLGAPAGTAPACGQP